jgi:hypothetical protein
MTTKTQYRRFALATRRAIIAGCSFVLLAGASIHVQAQTFLLDNVEFFDTSTGKKVKASKPSGITQEQQIIFPNSVGTTGQLLSISSVSGDAMTLGWQTVSVGSAASSDRLASAETVTTAGTATGLAVNVAANKIYRVEGMVLAKRVDPGSGSPSDNVKFTLSGPANTSRVSISVRCYDCTSPTGVPTNAKASSTSVSTGAIDPNSTTSDFTVHTYGIEGVVHVGATDGTLRLIVDDTGDASTNDIEMAAESYIVLTEID